MSYIRNGWPNTDRDPADVIEDMEWLVHTGEHPDNMPRRLGWTSRAALYRYLGRHGRNDLARIVDPTRTRAAA